MSIEGPSHVPMCPTSHQRHSRWVARPYTPNWRKHINRANRCRRAVAHTHVSYRKQVDKIHICGHVHVCEALRFSSSCAPRADGNGRMHLLYSGGCVVFQLPLFWLWTTNNNKYWFVQFVNDGRAIYLYIIYYCISVQGYRVGFLFTIGIFLRYIQK